eukprot:388177-Amphidinium_carterae.1
MNKATSKLPVALLKMELVRRQPDAESSSGLDVSFRITQMGGTGCQFARPYNYNSKLFGIQIVSIPVRRVNAVRGAL